jgi:hypothetical protein
MMPRPRWYHLIPEFRRHLPPWWFPLFLIIATVMWLYLVVAFLIGLVLVAIDEAARIAAGAEREP